MDMYKELNKRSLAVPATTASWQPAPAEEEEETGRSSAAHIKHEKKKKEEERRWQKMASSLSATVVSPAELDSCVDPGEQWRGALLIREKKLDGDDAAHQHVHGVGTGVHEVQFGHHRQCSASWGGVNQNMNANLHYSAANLVMSCSSVALWSSTGSPAWYCAASTFRRVFSPGRQSLMWCISSLLDGDDAAHQHVHGVGTGVHEVQFGHHRQCSASWGGVNQNMNANLHVAMSVLAAVTARMMQLGLEMCFKMSSRICTSMSCGWSTSVRLRTCGEKILRWMGSSLMPYSLCEKGGNLTILVALPDVPGVHVDGCRISGLLVTTPVAAHQALQDRALAAALWNQPRHRVTMDTTIIITIITLLLLGVQQAVDGTDQLLPLGGRQQRLTRSFTLPSSFCTSPTCTEDEKEDEKEDGEEDEEDEEEVPTWVPTTAIWGSWMTSAPTVLNTSCSLLMTGIRASMSVTRVSVETQSHSMSRCPPPPRGERVIHREKWEL
ncbi:hypothetical protein CRUP_034252 [Coryphaenoides rupestris]|nr:hypothetical protein CRUP_034252 [Coryphaenoides rupestris]